MVERLLYVAACLVAPMLWGLLAFAATRWVEKRLPKPKPVEKRLPDLEYYI